MALGTPVPPRFQRHHTGQKILQRIAIFLWRYTLWLNVIVGLLLLAERWFLFRIATWVFIVTSAFAIMLAIPQTFAPRFIRSRFGDEITRIILEDLLQTVEPSIRDRVHLRCNVMIRDGSALKMLAAYPEKTDPMGTVSWTVEQGCCGLAVRRQEPVVLNLVEFQGKPYDALLDPEDELPKWGITREQWEHTRDLGSIVSIPIFSIGPSPEIIGVLNFDATGSQQEWLEYAPDVKEQFFKRAMVVRRVLGLILMSQKTI